MSAFSSVPRPNNSLFFSRGRRIRTPPQRKGPCPPAGNAFLVKRRFLPGGTQGLLKGLKHRAGHRPDSARHRGTGTAGRHRGSAHPARARLPAAQAACGGEDEEDGAAPTAQPGPKPSGAAPALPRRPGTRVGSGRGGGPGKRRSSGSSEEGREEGRGRHPARSHAGPGSAPLSRGHSHCLRSSRHKAMGDTKRGGGDRRDGGARGEGARPGLGPAEGRKRRTSRRRGRSRSGAAPAARAAAAGEGRRRPEPPPHSPRPPAAPAARPGGAAH